MVTRNFLNVLAMTLQSGSPVGCLSGRDVNGETRFLTGSFTSGFPYSPTKTFTLNAASAGISIGTGSTPASEDDYNLEETITSGVNVTLTNISYGAQSPWYPYVRYDLTITNTGANPLVVTEVGYKQPFLTTKLIGSFRTESSNLLLDRCVLDTPVTITPGDAGIVTYRLQTNPMPLPPSVAGLQMASFSYGTDAQIAAILDAAAAGTIDLQRDAGWKVGDQRVISVAAFTAGGNVSVPAQNAAIVITSFDEYMSCGNVMQFDFACCVGRSRISAANTTTGGYGATEMKTVTLPALAEALPDWLRTRLKTFSVPAGSGGAYPAQQTLETVTGNRLALRSAVEILGNGSAYMPDEGSAMAYYGAMNARRVKPDGISGTPIRWWDRSAETSNFFSSIDNNGNDYMSTADSVLGIAPFGCL